MADQRDEEVRKGAHCAWPIHSHIVFPVTYRKALLDEEVTGIIQETATELAERFPIEMEAMGTDKNHIHGLCGAHPKMAPGRIVQICKRLTAREICRRKPAVKRVLWGGVGWGILDRRVRCGDGGRAWELADGGTVRPAPRATRGDLRQLRML